MVANSYFQFKQFRVEQTGVAMKVTTEGCVLGAWTAARAKRAARILDIGAGTGLLTLMLAQACPDADIFASEADEMAAKCARANFDASPWASRLHLIFGPVQALELSPFDLIICNPPFYNRSLQSPDASINLARHDDSLSQEVLAHTVDRLLSREGEAFVLYPELEAGRFSARAADVGLFRHSTLIVRNGVHSPVFRMIGQYTRSVQSVSTSELIIRGTDGLYSDDFSTLLGAYYLHL